MLIQERSGEISVPSETNMRWRRLRWTLLSAVGGLALFIVSCAFSGTLIGIVLALGAITLGIVSIVWTLIMMKLLGSTS